MEERRAREEATEWKSIRRGWCLGDAEFKAELLAQMNGRFGANHDGEERGESSEEHAERIVCRELREHGWKEKDLPERRKVDPVKGRIARRLRKETTMTYRWIADRLGMGSASTVKYTLAQKWKARRLYRD